eukprot:TRINITY_DN13843_c0_g1_i1.p1 TRINITY_DN13843_c0_g1~~TRINITY_DN13843_c0_g1_i1.p1  ORF type:complete len:209 (+),score=35.05 TRINITY_DN13843_c0_g1_i1:469-1095(+)
MYEIRKFAPFYNFSPIIYIVSFYRIFLPFRFINSFGVFGVEGVEKVPIRQVTTVEGFDGLFWRQFEMKYLTCTEENPPKIFAPHHPRVDMNMWYFSRYVSGSSFSLVNPFVMPGCWIYRLLSLIHKRDPDALELFPNFPFADHENILVLRTRQLTMRYTTYSDLLKSKKYFSFVASVPGFYFNKDSVECCALKRPKQITSAFWRNVLN